MYIWLDQNGDGAPVIVSTFAILEKLAQFASGKIKPIQADRAIAKT